MNQANYLTDLLVYIIQDINYDIDMLNSCSMKSRRGILNHIKSRLCDIESILGALSRETAVKPDPQPVVSAVNENPNARVFTPTELLEYNGKNGMPAYVAVNGTVYNVTNNAAWAAATHFGLNAGENLTTPYASCHDDSAILKVLPVVGTLAQNQTGG